MKKSAKAVQKAIDEAGLQCEVMELPASTRSAKDAAAAIGCKVEEIAKSIIFQGEESKLAIMVIASGTNRINEKMVSTEVGEQLKQATPEFAREVTGYAIGGVPPCGHKSKIRILLDSDLMNFEQVWAAAGTPNAVFKLTPSDLTLLTQGQVIKVVA